MTVFNVRDTIGIKEFKKKWLSKSLATSPGGNIMWTNARAGPWNIPVLQWLEKSTTNLKQGKSFDSKRALDLYSW